MPMRTEDSQLAQESGFPALVRYLLDAVAQADQLSRRSVAHDVCTGDDLSSGLATGRTAGAAQPRRRYGADGRAAGRQVPH